MGEIRRSVRVRSERAGSGEGLEVIFCKEMTVMKRIVSVKVVQIERQ